jgi:hypothetical protein
MKGIKKMKQSVKMVKAASLFMPALAIAVVSLVSPVGAESKIQEGANAVGSNGGPTDIFGAGGVFTTVINIALFIIGSLSVVMLIIGGIRYTLSGGNKDAVTSAKNTILYAIIGVVVAILAYAIVNFVLTSLMPA